MEAEEVYICEASFDWRREVVSVDLAKDKIEVN